MRIITWNCCVGDFRTKIAKISEFEPDLLAVQEMEDIDQILWFPGSSQPTFRHRSTDPSTNRGVGVLSFKNAIITPVDDSDPMAFRRFDVTVGSHNFQIVSVWTADAKPHKAAYKQAHEGIARHRAWIRQKPTVILGDFNHSASFDGRAWRSLMDLIEPLELKSAYHEFFGEDFGSETRFTHYHGGKQTSTFHIDYCFIPKDWVSRLRSVQVGSYEDWRPFSDHVPLIVDLED